MEIDGARITSVRQIGVDVAMHGSTQSELGR